MSSRGKPKSKATDSRRSKKQATKDRYAHAREDAQLQGIIPTAPEEALKPEVVDPTTQSEQKLPALVREAIRRGWAVPSELKPQLVDELINVLLDADTKTRDKVASFVALTKADWQQYKQDNPEEAAKLRGPTTLVVNIETISERPVETVEVVEIDAKQEQVGSTTDGG